MRRVVFIVENDMTNLSDGRNNLSDVYDVVALNSGALFLAILKNVTPDLILLDTNMPEMNGDEMVKKLKSDAKTARTPVIFLTTLSDKQAVLKGLALGVSDFIVKPFTSSELLTRLEAYFNKGESKSAVRASTPASADKPSAEAEKPTPPSGASADFFPEGHKRYDLAIPSPQEDLLSRKTFICPLCKQKVSAYSVRTVRLSVADQSKTFRIRHNGIDTIHYEIITCPHCCFSAFENSFEASILPALRKNIDQIDIYKDHIGATDSIDRNINDVFAGYYLALKSAELFHKRSEVNIAKIWMRLMWLYGDCEDSEMEAIATTKAQSSYLDVFSTTEVGPKAFQQICAIIAELSLLMGDLAAAKKFFFNAKTAKDGVRPIVIQAEDGIERIREIEQSAQDEPQE